MAGGKAKLAAPYFIRKMGREGRFGNGSGGGQERGRISGSRPQARMKRRKSSVASLVVAVFSSG
ncbi:MAG TPA: hypothetical protein VIQ39_03490, partial [Methyloceanibacter sp.]